MAFRIPPEQTHDTRIYLKRRENVTNTYAALIKPVRLLDGSHREVGALCYLVNRSHPQYAGALRLDKQANLVRRGIGASGPNIDYVLNTVMHLREADIYDVRLERLMSVLGHGRFK